MPTFKSGDFVVHVTGGPVFVVKFVTYDDEYYCERWSEIGFVREQFTPATIRLATQAEIDLMKNQL
jgi:uncharacterized protein YodC (DUF2158 family)